MIKSKKELYDYLEADRIALGRSNKKPSFFDLVWKFERSLRMNEFYNNCKKGLPWYIVKNFTTLNSKY